MWKKIGNKGFLIVIFELILVSYIYILYDGICNRQVSYEIERIQAETVSVEQEVITFPISFYENNVLTYRVGAEVISGENTNIYFEFFDEYGNVLINGCNTIEEIKVNKAIVIHLQEHNLEKEKNYYLKLYTDPNTRIDLKEYEGILLGQELYDFMYKEQVKVFCIILIIISFIIMCVVAYGKSFWMKFLMVAIFLHIFQNIASIPCSAPDDFRHFVRAYDIAVGNLTCQNYIEDIYIYGEAMPVAYLPEEYAKLTDLSIQSSDAWYSETNTRLFMPKWFSLFGENESNNIVECAMLATDEISPIAYFPQSIFILFAKIMGLSPIMVYYMARMGNFVFSLLMIISAIKIVPQRKLLFTVLYFVPGMNFLRSSCSTDGILYTCVLMLLSLFFKMWDDKELYLNWKYTISITLLVSVIGCIKLPYILIAAVFLFLPFQEVLDKDLFKENFKKIIGNLVILMGSWLISFVVYKITSNYFPYGASVSTESMLNYIFNNLGQVISLIFYYLYANTYDYVLSGMAGQLANGGYIAFSYMILVYWVASKERGRTEFTNSVRAMATALLIGMILIIYAVFFLVSDPSSGVIGGIQGRYLLPIMTIVALIIPKGREQKEDLEEFTYISTFFIGMLQVMHTFKCFIA